MKDKIKTELGESFELVTLLCKLSPRSIEKAFQNIEMSGLIQLNAILGHVLFEQLRALNKEDKH